MFHDSKKYWLSFQKYLFQLPVQIESSFIFGVNLFDFNSAMSKIEKDRGLDHFGMTLILVD